MATMTKDMQDKILSSPEVEAAVKRAGQNALNDPAVQEQILKTCKEKFPEYAGAAGAKVKEWAKDPEVQARAKAYAGVALTSIAGAGSALLKQIEQGPAGVRVLAFLVSMASATLAVIDLFNIFNIFGHLVLYVVSVYQFIGAMTTVLFEVPPDWHIKVQEKTGLPISSYQDFLIEQARFLSSVMGRGLFYIFQGTMWLAFASFTEFLELGVGAALVFIGCLHVFMHFGIMPQHVASKMREGYKTVASSSHSGAGAEASRPLNV